jgi:hypothetical protein
MMDDLLGRERVADCTHDRAVRFECSARKLVQHGLAAKTVIEMARAGYQDMGQGRRERGCVGEQFRVGEHGNEYAGSRVERFPPCRRIVVTFDGLGQADRKIDPGGGSGRVRIIAGKGFERRQSRILEGVKIVPGDDKKDDILGAEAAEEMPNAKIILVEIRAWDAKVIHADIEGRRVREALQAVGPSLFVIEPPAEGLAVANQDQLALGFRRFGSARRRARTVAVDRDGAGAKIDVVVEDVDETGLIDPITALVPHQRRRRHGVWRR